MSSPGGDQGALHSEVVSAIQQYMAWSRAWHFKVVGGAYQRRGVPDILCCWPPSGRLVAVEVKTGQGRLTLTQAEQLDELGLSGALCIIAASVDDVEEALIKHELVDVPLVVSRVQAAVWRAEAREASRRGQPLDP